MPQHPTCTRMRIRNVRDAQTILYACYIGQLPMIKWRLDSDDRHALAPGNVYAWEERGSRSTEPSGVGIERFTEGKRWTPSRLREDFLYYYEKYLHLSESDQKKLHPPANWDPFVKQTYSAWVMTAAGDRKWHLTAYYTDSVLDRLQTVDDIPLLQNIVVPEGHFRSNSDVCNRRRSDVSLDTPTRTYAAFPTPSFSNVRTPSPSSSLESQDSPDSAIHSPLGSIANLNIRDSDSRLESRTEAPYLDSFYPPPGIQLVSNLPPHLDQFYGSLENTPRSHDVRRSVIGGSHSVRSSHNTHGLTSSDGPQVRNSRPAALVPLHDVLRHRPYRREAADDRALRLLGSRA